MRDETTDSLQAHLNHLMKTETISRKELVLEVCELNNWPIIEVCEEVVPGTGHNTPGWPEAWKKDRKYLSIHCLMDGNVLNIFHWDGDDTFGVKY